MAKKITTGPFHVPLFPDGGAALFGRITNGLNIVLKNHSDERRTVKVSVDQCASVIFPAKSLEGPPALPETIVVLDPHECTIVPVVIAANTILRVNIKGQVDLDAEKMEVSVIGGNTNAGLVEFPSAVLFFRLDDFVEDDTDDDH